MALTSSGQLKVSEIATEFSDTAPHQLSEFYGAATGIPASGQITVSDFYGAAASAGGGGAQGQEEFISPGTYSWTAPAGVTSVCVVCVGAGAPGQSSGATAGGGGGLGYKNNITVTPGSSYTVVVGAGNTSTGTATGQAGSSYFINTSTVAGFGGNSNKTGGSYTGDGGGSGGNGGTGASGIESGGGGAGGYSGNGGIGASYPSGGPTSGAGGGGGGGGYGNLLAGGGGGVGIYGEGSSGGAGVSTTGNYGTGGGGGSSGNAGDTGTVNGGTVSGGLYGGGGFGRFGNGGTSVGAGGAVRIIWGDGRAFPSTNTGDVQTIEAPTGDDYSSSFTEISNRHIDSNTYMSGSASDYTGPYDVHQTEPVLASPAGSNARVYLAAKYTSSTTFYSDIPIAGVQHLNSSGTLQNSWIFNTSTGGSGFEWQTTVGTISQGATGMSTTPATASGYSYSSINSGATVNRMNWATSTGSSYTGAADGISSTYYSTPITTGTSDGAIPQFANTYYMYAEASGATLDSAVFARSPVVTINDGDYFVIIHAVTGYSANRQDANDCLWFAIY